VPSERLGSWVLDDLVQIDTLAAARFASVFRDFQNAEDYAAFFEAATARRASFVAGEPPSVRAPEPPRRPSA